jgi:hypothetical protein
MLMEEIPTFGRIHRRFSPTRLAMRRKSSLGLATLLLVFGCSEPGSPADTGPCGVFDACGGSLVGIWKLPGTEICADRGACDGPESVDQSEVYGSITFSGDGTFQWTFTINGSRSANYPPGCLSCTIGFHSADGLSTNCSIDSSGTCRCDYVYDNRVFSWQGTYSTSGGALRMEASQVRLPEAFCVQGDVLMLHTPGMPGEGWSSNVYARTFAYDRQ